MSNESPDQSLLHASLMEASVDGILAFDRECRYIAWNRAMECISGIRRDEALGKCAFDVFPFLKETGEFKYLLEALAGKSLVAENRPFAVPETGRAGFFEGYYSPLRNEAGEVIGGIAIVRDITGRKRAEELANDAHRRLRLHVENTPLAVIEWDKDYRVSSWLPSAERLFGWKAEEVLGKTIDDWKFVFPDDLEAVHEVGYRQRQGLEPHAVSRNRNYTKQGTVLHSEWYNSVLHDESGELISVLSLVLDVTERKRIEEAMRESEEQYRLLFESNTHAMWVYDLETLKFLAVNDAAVEQYGYSREEFLSMTLTQIRPPDEVQKLHDYLTHGSPAFDRAGEWRHQKKDGTIITIEITSHGLDFAGKRAELVMAIDITERKLAEQALLESEDRYRDLVDNSHELMCTHDLKGRIISVNPWAARVLGYKQDALIGMNIRAGLMPEYRDQFDDYLREIQENGFARGIMRVRTASGETRLWEYYNTLRTQGVQTPIVRGMAHDVTERRQALAREKEARLEAESANRIKDEFLSTLSHELRTPLTAILGWSNLLLNGHVDQQKQPKALETISRNARFQAQLIDDLLEVSRIITGKLRLNFGPCELQPVIEAVVESIQPTAEAKAVRLQLLLEPQGATVYGDADRLRQVIWNLLSNAVKFTPRNGSVVVDCQRTNSHIVITVRDSGEGIKPGFLPHVFERFSQANGSTTRAHGGLGLGLAIVRHLVELHGGAVRAESQGEGLGATFKVMLPLMQTSNLPAPAAKFQDNKPAGSDIERIAHSTSLAGLRLLVVDDEQDFRELVTAMLGRYGAEVRVADSASQAVAYVESWKPDVLVADIGMREEDGYGLIGKVRALSREKGGNTPAIALTAYTRTEDRVRALSAGYQIHLAKPVEGPELARAVVKLARSLEGSARSDAAALKS
ncbi:MAG TPA: PAS domain S-box protein [Pyrinomonadaceae bacterium]